jgi:dGTP triphosphohydrolase
MVGEDPVLGFLAEGIWILVFDTDANEEGRTKTSNGHNDYIDDSIGNFLDLQHDIQQQVYDTFNMVDDSEQESLQKIHVAMQEDAKVTMVDELHKLYKEASILVWRTVDIVSSVSIISIVVVLMTMCSIHGISNAFIDELFINASTKAKLPSKLLLSWKEQGAQDGPKLQCHTLLSYRSCSFLG